MTGGAGHPYAAPSRHRTSLKCDSRDEKERELSEDSVSPSKERGYARSAKVGGRGEWTFDQNKEARKTSRPGHGQKMREKEERARGKDLPSVRAPKATRAMIYGLLPLAALFRCRRPRSSPRVRVLTSQLRGVYELRSFLHLVMLSLISHSSSSSPGPFSSLRRFSFSVASTEFSGTRSRRLSDVIAMLYKKVAGRASH